MSIDLKKLSTEERNLKTMNIDILPTIDILKIINEEDQMVAHAVAACLPQIEVLVDSVVSCFKKGGRLIYMGAGTSGRIGLMDATECPPTYGVPKNMVMCLMAGGDKAMVSAVEGAEDSITLGIEDLKRCQVNSNDIVVGIAASGRTPYVMSALAYAKELNVKTGCITTSFDNPMAKFVDCPVVAVTGAEPIAGSTRMKSGTAQKMICNMVTTTAMIKMGKVYQNLMVDVMATNEKLISRAHKIIVEATGMSPIDAPIYLAKYGTIKNAIYAYITGQDDITKIEQAINEAGGNLRSALKVCGK